MKNKVCAVFVCKLEYKKILVYRIGHLGDTLVALPAFWEIRNAFPNAEITLLTNSDAKNPQFVMAQEILPQTGLFDNLLTYPSQAGKISSAVNYTKLFWNLKKEKFDCLYYLTTRNRTQNQIRRDLKFFRSAGIKKIFGTEYLAENFLDFEQPKPLPEVEAEYMFLLKSLPREIFKNDGKIIHDLLLTGDETEFAKDWLKKNCGHGYEQKDLIAVAPGSKWESKIWSEEKFIEVIRQMNSRKKIFPVIFGGREDREKGNRILKALNTGANAAGDLNIRQAAAALSKCRMYLGNDTGTMHLAATVGVPCVGIFAAIDFPGRWKPFGDKNRIFRFRVECEGCHTPDCFNNHKCLESVTVEEVLRTSLELLDKI